LQGAARELPYLPKGTTVSALWRTEQKSVAAGRSDFWYRVQVVVDRELYPVETGWVFGAFLEALPE
jgi:hypothetical protein